MMDLVKNDNRFSFHFYGSSNLEPILKSYADRLSCDRIKFFGSYKASEKRKIIDQVDILFNAYGNDRPLLTCALSNKLYDALYYKKMLITSPGTYMEELGGYLAYSIDFNQEKSLDSLYEWYMTRDEKLVEDYANTMFAQVVKENDETIQKIMVKVMEV